MTDRTVLVLWIQIFLSLDTTNSKFFDYLNYKILANDGSRNQCHLKYLDFPCSYREKSHPRPTNVNKLQPADIELVAALGDSVIGSTGADAPNLFHTRSQYRGVSFAIGAWQSWRTITTLPNILKVFNPALVGGSVNIGGEFERGTNLNLASPGATSRELIEQAKRLIKMLSTSGDRYKWKVVTILMGHNDVCTHPCNTTYTAFDASPRPYMMRIAEALDLLRDNLPNTFVNFVPLIDITITLDMFDKHPFCRLAHRWVCPCLYGGFGGTPLTRDQMSSLLHGYMKEVQLLIDSARYETEDFTVVIQPAFTNLELFTVKGTEVRPGSRPPTDYSFFAPDCLHPSQKLHALMARALWNNMFSPLGSKATSWSNEPPLLCPTADQPYLRTRLNSQQINMTMVTSDYVNYMNTVVQHNIGCYM